MDIERLKQIADGIEPRQPDHLDLGGHKVVRAIQELKAQFRDVISILIEDEEEKGKKKKKKS